LPELRVIIQQCQLNIQVSKTIDTVHINPSDQHQISLYHISVS